MGFYWNRKFVNLFLVIILVFSVVFMPLGNVSIAESIEAENELVLGEMNEENMEVETYESVNEDEGGMDDYDKENITNDNEKVVEDDKNHNETSSEVDDLTNSQSFNKSNENRMNSGTDNNSIDELLSLNFRMSDEVITTGTSAEISWTVDHDIIDYFEIELYNFDSNERLIVEVPGNVRSYKFTGLTPGVEYSAIVLPYINGEIVAEDIRDFRPYWSENELYPVNMILLLNDYPDYYDYIRIKGLDNHNKKFIIEEQIDYFNTDLRMPLGKFEVLIYNEDEPTISESTIIEIKAGFDYLNNPIQLKFDLNEMRKKAEPFHFEIIDVTENSFTIRWNPVSKITSFRLFAWDYDTDYYKDYMFGNDITEYTFDGLASNYTHYIDLHISYLHDLKKYESFNLKTLGEDSKAPKVDFENKTLKNEVSKQSGIYLRDITEADMEKIRSIEIPYKEIDSLKGLEYAKNLHYLDLFANKISDLSILKNLTQLSHLDLSYNRIENIEALENLTDLNYLNLEQNMIHDISKLKKLTDLTYLNISYNEIENIDVLANFNNLYILHANSNKISNISPLANLLDLEELNLNYNNISDITPIENLKNIYWLNIQNNRIKNIEPLVNLTELEFLNLTDNHITSIPDLGRLTKLEKLYLDNNSIIDISNVLGLSNLELLNLEGNKITNLPDLSSLTNLKELYLDHNKLTDISGVKGLRYLESLTLSYNEITELPDLSSLTNLEYLNLSDNNITDISGLEGLNELIELDLSYNDIKDLSVLKGLKRLQYVYLYGMEINDLDIIYDLRNEGVQVFVDDDPGDWNDWDWTEFPWVDGEIDAVAVQEAFPEDLGFEVSEDGKEIRIDIRGLSENEPFTITPEQLEVLTNKEQKVIVSRGEVETAIPASTFRYSSDPVEIFVTDMGEVEGALSRVYDFTIYQGNKRISQFEEAEGHGVTLTFNVNADRARNPNNLKVHYYDEELGKWVNIGGTYRNGTVTVVTYHFSLFTVFEVDEASDELIPDDSPIKDDKKPIDTKPGTEDRDQKSENDQNNKTNRHESNAKDDEKSVLETSISDPDQKDKLQSTIAGSSINEESKQLPKTATNTYNVLLAGIMFVLIGGIALFIRQRKIKEN